MWFNGLFSIITSFFEEAGKEMPQGGPFWSFISILCLFCSGMITFGVLKLCHVDLDHGFGVAAVLCTQPASLLLLYLGLFFYSINRKQKTPGDILREIAERNGQYVEADERAKPLPKDASPFTPPRHDD